ncbi:hypothetical protein LTR75_007235 [Friedmanniomyces endolithicus]|nr:hypothetical protein LTR75_007235 [Friedmanniomyces endolithicus]
MPCANGCNSTSLAAWRKDPEKYQKNKVIDTDLPDDDPFNKIFGVADWEFYPKYRSKEEREKSNAESEKDGLPPKINETMMKDFIGQLGEAKEEQLGGQPFVYLHILATHPKHHRRGVGAMHLRWGFEQAETLGLPVYLESSPMGRPLYARNGFETKGWLPFDARKYGSEKELPHALMLRPAKGELQRSCASSPRQLVLAVMAFTPNILASGEESTSRTVTDTPSTHPTKDKEVAKLLAVVVSHARSAEDGVRLIRSMADLAYRKHGLALLEDDHVRALMVDGITTALSQAAPRPGLVSATVRRGDISRSLPVLVDRTAGAATAVRMLQELTRLYCERYGRAVIENKHVAMMNVDGTLNWISSSFSDGLIQAINVAAAASHDHTAEFSEPLRDRPESALISTGPAASQALPGSKCRRTRRGGRNQRKRVDGTPKRMSSSQGGETVHPMTPRWR